MSNIVIGVNDIPIELDPTLNEHINATVFTDLNLDSKKIKAIHINEIENALNIMETKKPFVNNCGNCIYCETCQSCQHNEQLINISEVK